MSKRIKSKERRQSTTNHDGKVPQLKPGKNLPYTISTTHFSLSLSLVIPTFLNFVKNHASVFSWLLLPTYHSLYSRLPPIHVSATSGLRYFTTVRRGAADDNVTNRRSQRPFQIGIWAKHASKQGAWPSM